MRRDDVEHALDALTSEVAAPTSDAASLIALGRQRLRRQRAAIIGIALAFIATAAGVGAVANNHDARRAVAPTPTTTAPGFGPSREIAVASSLEAWKCLNPLQYTNDGGHAWDSITLPEGTPTGSLNCAAVAGGNAWAIWRDSKSEVHILRIRRGKDAEVFSLPQFPERIVLGPLTFVDRDHGWVHTYNSSDSAPDYLYRTLDGGATWKLATTNVGAGPLAFADAHHGWSSDGAELSYTDDGGVTWRGFGLPEPAAPARTLALFQIDARNKSIIVWRGAPISGVRYRPFFDVSTDGGSAWALRRGPEGFELPGVEGNTFAATDGLHWALTSGNALRVTTDGGRTWQARPDVPGVASVRRIYFPTADIGWITADTGAILRTIDGARTWTDVTNGATPETTTTTPIATEPAVPAQLAFASATEGWICDDPFEYTTDAFETVVKRVDIPTATTMVTPDYYQEPLCAAAPGGNAWLLRGSGNPEQPELVRIRSGGSDVRVFPFARIRRATVVVSMTFVDADHGWALVARQSTSPGDSRELYRTRDGGATWSRILQDALIGGSLTFDTPDHGWATAAAGAQLVTTTDGGRTWREVAVPSPAPLRGLPLSIRGVQVRGDAIVAFGGQTTGNVFSPFFDVSTDGGRSWSRRPGPRALPETLADNFDAADADHWAVGWSNYLYVTDDAGKSWSERAQFAGVYMIEDIALLDANVAFVSGLGDPLHQSAVVLKTTDGGDHWTTVDEQAPVGPPGDVASFPGGIIGCPTRPLTPGLPTIAIAHAALAYVKFPNPSVSAVYRGSSEEGGFGRIFSFNVGSCGPDVLDNIWVAYVHGVPNAGQGGSTARVALALAHYADGWHVFGRYP